MTGAFDHIRVTIIDARGSSPREIGAYMNITPDGIDGTIGGGALEWQAIAHARQMLADQPKIWHRECQSSALGPQLGQCCGGTVKLLFEYLNAQVMAARLAPDQGIAIVPIIAGTAPQLILTRAQAKAFALPLAGILADMMAGLGDATARLVGHADLACWVEPAVVDRVPMFLYGAGHVGRAIVQIADDLGFDIHWVDILPSRFPDDLPGKARAIIATDPALIARYALGGAYHLVMTHSHALDLAICAEILRKGDFDYLGVIGSMTKRARFLSQLDQLGLGDAARAHMHCPIGNDAIKGKQPKVIAISVLADLIARRQVLAGNIKPSGIMARR